jgi:hypothetical protein
VLEAVVDIMGGKVCEVCGTENPPFSSNARLAVDYCRTCQTIQPFVMAASPVGAAQRKQPKGLRQRAMLASAAVAMSHMVIPPHTTSWPFAL